jgi:hypothetical protein
MCADRDRREFDLRAVDSLLARTAGHPGCLRRALDAGERFAIELDSRETHRTRAAFEND